MSKSLYVLIALVIGASSVFAQSHFGKKLEIQPTKVGISYSYDYAWGWMISLKSTLKSEDIASLPERITVYLVNPDSKKVYHVFEEVPKSQLLVTQLSIRNEEELREILPIQKDLSLAFVNPEDGSYIYYLSISEICSQYPSYVKDLTKSDRKACVVDKKDFYKSEDCDTQRLRLLESIKQGFITCKAAKEFYEKMGCGELDCK